MPTAAFDRYLRDGDVRAMLDSTVETCGAVERASFPELHRLCDVTVNGQSWRISRIVDLETGDATLFAERVDVPSDVPGVAYFLEGAALIEWARAESAEGGKNPPPTIPGTIVDALGWLRQSHAPERLLRHAELVATVADELSREVRHLGSRVNHHEVVVGAALHDIGKIVHPAELTGPGIEHESAGEQLLLSRGVPADLARFCRTHGLPAADMPAIEDVIVALADKLWRGARRQELEAALVDRVAAATGDDRWAKFDALDAVFERIANQGERRLADQRDTTSGAPR